MSDVSLLTFCNKQDIYKHDDWFEIIEGVSEYQN